MAIQSLPILPAYPSTTVRSELSASQLSSLLSTVSDTLSDVLSLSFSVNTSSRNSGRNKDSSKVTESLSTSTLAFLRTYLQDQAFQGLQTLIWGPNERSYTEKAIHANVLKLAELLGEQGALDDLKALLDLAIVYARASPLRVQRIFENAVQRHPRLVLEVETDLVASFTTFLDSAQGLYNQRKAVECIFSFVLASSPPKDNNNPSEAPLLAPFPKNTAFITALAKLYLPGLTATARSYGGTPALLNAISSSSGVESVPDPTEWTTIWLNTKLCLIDSFHLLFKLLLANLASASSPAQIAGQTELAFSVVFAVLEASPSDLLLDDNDGPREGGSSSAAARPTPFLNLSLLQDYQNTHDLTRLLSRALSKAQERDARLDLLESALSTMSEGKSSSGRKDPGALKLLLCGSGLQRRTMGDTKGKAPAVMSAAPTSSSTFAVTGPPLSEDETPNFDLASKTSQILDLLPDLSTDYVGKLLKHPNYAGDVERVIGALLDGSALGEAELGAIEKEDKRSAERSEDDISQRRNVFDDVDEVIDPDSIRFGKRKLGASDFLFNSGAALREQMKADILRRVEIMETEDLDESEEEEDPFAVDEDGKPKAKPKTKIVAFEDDDELEETIQVAGGDGEEPDDDSSVVEGEPEAGPETIIELAYITDPSVFARDAVTRRSKARADLKQKTGWADEQIEGWAIMLERNPKRKDKILNKHEFKGNLNHPSPGPSTPGPREPDSSHGPHPRGGRGRGQPHRGRGGGGGRGGGPGQGEGSGGGQGQARDRAWKDKNKANRGNHNRKRGHDKKMARALGGPAT